MTGKATRAALTLAAGGASTDAADRVTLLVWIRRRVGVLGFPNAVTVVWQWLFVTQKKGAVPTTLDYSRYWFCGERTAERHAAIMRTIFGDDWRLVVVDLLAQTQAALVARKGPGALASFSVPDVPRSVVRSG